MDDGRKKMCMEMKSTEQVLPNSFQILETLDRWWKSDFSGFKFGNVDEQLRKIGEID